MQSNGSAPAVPTKRCSACGQDVPAAAFVKNSRHADGLAELCKACKRETQRAKVTNDAGWRIAVAEKRCATCGETKPAAEFHANRYSKDGLKSFCKACNSAKTRAYTAANREDVSARRQAAYRARIDEMKARDKARRERDHEKRRAQKRAYHVRNAEKIRAKATAWHRANLERARARSRDYMKRFPEGQWRRNAERRARVRNAPVVEKVDRKTIIERDRSICGICGKFVEAKDLHLDHIVPLFQGGTHTAANLRVTHKLCNLSRKRVGYAEQLPMPLD